MENNTNQLSDLFKNIQNGLKQYSVSEFNDLVCRVLKTKTRFEKNDEVNYIVAIVCEHYKLSKRNFMTTRLGGNSTEARQIASCLLHNKLGLSQRHIASYYSVSPRIVNVAIKRLKTVDLSIKWDKEFKEAYEFLEKKLNTFIIDKNK